MANGLAYHLVVNALEARAGWTPMARFSSAVFSVIGGHLPYDRYFAAGRARKVEGMGSQAIEGHVLDWLATDVNPSVQTMRMLKDPSNAVRAYNSYNASASLAVRTSIVEESVAAAPVAWGKAKREALLSLEDPEPCRIGSLAVLEALLSIVESNARQGEACGSVSLSRLAKHLGVESSAAAEIAMVFEAEGHTSVTDAASTLGCHSRTLQRSLRSEGVTAEAVRQAVRLTSALDKLGSMDSLTTIAHEVGFSDLAHMSRAFQASCGMPPSLLRNLMRADGRGKCLATPVAP